MQREDDLFVYWREVVSEYGWSLYFYNTIGRTQHAHGHSEEQDGTDEGVCVAILVGVVHAFEPCKQRAAADASCIRFERRSKIRH